MPRLEWERDRDRVDVALAEVAHRGTGILRERLGLELRAVAESDEQDALDRQISNVNERHFVGLSFYLARRQDVGDRAAQLLIGSLGGSVEASVTEDGDDQGTGLE